MANELLDSSARRQATAVILTKSNEFKIVAEEAAVDVAASDVIAIGQREIRFWNQLTGSRAGRKLLSVLPVSDIADGHLVSTLRLNQRMQCKVADVVSKLMKSVLLGVAVVLLSLSRSLPADTVHCHRSVVDQPKSQASVLLNRFDNSATLGIRAAVGYGVKIRRPVFRCRRRPAAGCYLHQTQRYRPERRTSRRGSLCAQCCADATSMPT